MASKSGKDDFNVLVKGVHKAVSTATKEKLKGEPLSARIIELMYKELGGITIYVPMGIRGHTTARNQLIVEQYNGRNVKELAHIFGLSMQQIYKILSTALEKKRQEEETEDATNRNF